MAFLKTSRWRLMYSPSFCKWRVSSKELRQYLRKDSEKMDVDGDHIVNALYIDAV
jgi:hypothetical protein